MTRARRGITLIELVAVLSASAAILAVALGVAHAMLRAQRAGADHVRHCGAVDRLAEQFREDVHAAAGVGGEADRWRLDLGGGRFVEYRMEPDAMVRTEYAAQSAVARDSFALPPQCVARIEQGTWGEAAMVGLVIESLDGAAAQPGRRAVRIDAVRGRDLRWSEEETP